MKPDRNILQVTATGPVSTDRQSVYCTNRRSGTSPIVLHFPGDILTDDATARQWKQLVDVLISRPAIPVVNSADVTVLTWHGWDREYKPNGLMEAVARTLGVVPWVLQGPADWTNVMKTRLTLEALSSVKTPYVIGLDSSDVLLLDHPAVVVHRFKQMQLLTNGTLQLLYNGTGGWVEGTWPPDPSLAMFEEKIGAAEANNWLNAGCWIGDADFCRDYFTEMVNEPESDEYPGFEQPIIRRCFPRWWPQVDVDRHCHIFQWWRDPDIYVEGR